MYPKYIVQNCLRQVIMGRGKGKGRGGKRDGAGRKPVGGEQGQGGSEEVLAQYKRQNQRELRKQPGQALPRAERYPARYDFLFH